MRGFEVGVVCACVLAFGAPQPCEGQIPLEGVAISGGYYGWGGSNVDGLEAGSRFNVSVFGLNTPTLALALTGTYGVGGLEGTEADVQEWGLGISLRRLFGSPSAAARFFVDAHLGWTQLRVDIAEVSSDVEENGISVGPGMGVSIPIASSFRTFVAFDALLHRYGEIRFSEGEGTGESGNSGWRVGGRVGLTWLPGGDF